MSEEDGGDFFAENRVHSCGGCLPEVVRGHPFQADPGANFPPGFADVVRVEQGSVTAGEK